MFARFTGRLSAISTAAMRCNSQFRSKRPTARLNSLVAFDTGGLLKLPFDLGRDGCRAGSSCYFCQETERGEIVALVHLLAIFQPETKYDGRISPCSPGTAPADADAASNIAIAE